jgi:FkbM family methyltransferase
MKKYIKLLSKKIGIENFASQIYEYLLLSRAIGIFRFLKFLYQNTFWKYATITGVSKYPIRLRSRSSDINIFNQTFARKFLDHSTLKYLKPKNILDLGANIGTVSLYFKNLFPESKIIAVEPDPENADQFLENTKCYEDILLIKKGVWPHSTNLNLLDQTNIPGEHWGYSFFEDPNGPYPAISIIDILNQFNISFFDIAKIDIEGAEKKLFSENNEWLNKMGLVIVETHDRIMPGSEEAVLNAAHIFGFTVDKIGEYILLKR